MGYFLITLSLFVTSVFFIVISMFGLSYMGQSSGSSLFLISVLTVNICAAVYIFYYELCHYKRANGSLIPYFIPFLLLICYYFEKVFTLAGNTVQSFSIFKDILAITSLGIWAGTFCYRYDKFSEIAKNTELIMFICTIGIVMALPTMFLTSMGPSIGGAGDHQILSYMSALAFGTSAYRYFVNPDSGYCFFNNKIYHKFSLIIMLLQVLLCIIGGGRGGFVLLMAIAFFSVLALKMNVKRLILAIVIVVVGVLFIGDLSGTEEISNSIERVFSIFSSTNAADVDSERNRLYQIAWSLFEESPLFGYGIFRQYDLCFQKTYLPYWHNLFLDFLLQGGLILFMFGSITTIKVIKGAWQIMKIDKEHFLLLPLSLYPFTMLLFSGTYLTNAMFWFILIYVLGKSKIIGIK